MFFRQSKNEWKRNLGRRNNKANGKIKILNQSRPNERMINLEKKRLRDRALEAWSECEIYFPCIEKQQRKDSIISV